MYSLVFLALLGLAAASPQAIFPYSYGMMPYASHLTPYMHAGVVPYVPKMYVPTHDVMAKSFLPKPVEDTPEVKMAKEAFAVEYQKALMGMRQKRDLTVMPIHHTMGYTNAYTNAYNFMPYHIPVPY